MTSPVTPSFNDLADMQITDMESELVESSPKRAQKDDGLVKYLIGEISNSEEDNVYMKPDAHTAMEEKENINPKTNLHETNTKFPLDVNVVVENANGNGKYNMIKPKVTGRGDHSLTKQEVRKDYIRKGKDLSKLKVHA